ARWVLACYVRLDARRSERGGNIKGQGQGDRNNEEDWCGKLGDRLVHRRLDLIRQELRRRAHVRVEHRLRGERRGERRARCGSGDEKTHAISPYGRLTTISTRAVRCPMFSMPVPAAAGARNGGPVSVPDAFVDGAPADAGVRSPATPSAVSHSPPFVAMPNV